MTDAPDFTCQICGRALGAAVGVVSHHGYQRPGDGKQTPSPCPGARNPPYERDRTRLRRYVEELRMQVEKLAQRVAALEADALDLELQKSFVSGTRFVQQKGQTQTLRFTRATLDVVRARHAHDAFRYAGDDAKTFDDFRRAELDETQRLWMLRSLEHAAMKRRLDAPAPADA